MVVAFLDADLECLTVRCIFGSKPDISSIYDTRINPTPCVVCKPAPSLPASLKTSTTASFVNGKVFWCGAMSQPTVASLW